MDMGLSENKGMPQKEVLTRSPYVNELIRICREVKEGKKDPQELRTQLDSLKEMIDTLDVTADALKLTQPKSEGFEEDYARMKELFDLFREELDNIELYFEEGDEKYLEEPLEKIKTIIAEIFEISDKFKKVEDAQEVYSKSPFINDLIRVGKGVYAGEFPVEPFKVRFDIVRDIFEDTYNQVMEMSNLPPDTKALEEELPNIKEALEMMREGFAELEEFFEEEGEKDKELIPPALEKIQKASSTINEAQEKIAEEIREIVEAKSMRVCMRCGAKTPIKEKYCTSCNALLPPLPQEAMPSHALDLTVGEAVVQQEQRLVPPNVRKIYESALKVGRGEISKEEFKETIDWYEGIIEKTKKEMTKIAKPKKLGEEEEIVFEDTKKLLEDGVKEAEEGINELKKYMEDEDKEHLIKGVNTLMDAGEKLYQVKQIGEKARREMERQKQRKK